jgi:DNA polymerase III delta subunit
MIYVVHGDNLSYSRKIILNQQKKLGETARTEVSVADITPQDLQNLVTSPDLFGTPPFIVLDISELKRTNPKDYIEVIKQTPEEATLIILSPKELGKTSPFLALAVNGAKIILNKTQPKSNVFKLVDSLFKGFRKAAYKELQTLTLEDQDPFYIFSMILYGARKNSGNFEPEQLKALFNELYSVDKKAKTGEIPIDMMLTLTVEKVLSFTEQK